MFKGHSIAISEEVVSVRAELDGLDWHREVVLLLLLLGGVDGGLDLPQGLRLGGLLGRLGWHVLLGDERSLGLHDRLHLLVDSLASCLDLDLHRGLGDRSSGFLGTQLVRSSILAHRCILIGVNWIPVLRKDGLRLLHLEGVQRQLLLSQSRLEGIAELAGVGFAEAVDVVEEAAVVEM